MCNIDEIMDMLDWNNNLDEQIKGRELAKEVKSINVFLQPLDQYHNKNVWDNCAKILSDRSDKELMPYLFPLLEWLQDMNWPGALCILDRVNKYADDRSFDFAFRECIRRATALDDHIWLNNLHEINRRK